MSLSYLHIAVPHMSQIKTLRNAVKARDAAQEAGVQLEIHCQYGQHDVAKWSEFGSPLNVGLFFDVCIAGHFTNNYRPTMKIDLVRLRALLEKHQNAPGDSKITLRPVSK